jgi:hypothetical protein
VRDALSAGTQVIPKEKATKTSAPAARVPSAVAPAPDQVAAILVRSSASPVIFSGRITTMVYLFRNTGTAAWVKGTPAEARLGILNEDRELFELGMSVAWPHPTRPASQAESIVKPGGTAQFSFRVKGTVPGRYQLRVAPVIDGVAWTDAATPLDITVRDG